MSTAGKTPVYSEVNVDGGIIYLGKEDVDGSWRIFADQGTGKLFIQVRVAGVWETRDEFSALAS